MLLKKILILDDDPDLLAVMDMLLADVGYETLLLSSGDRIKEHIEQFCPDLILMDVMLAGMDGREICKILKSDSLYRTPIILISGTHNLGQVMFQEGAPNDFIAKPFDLDQLLEKVAVHLGQ